MDGAWLTVIPNKKDDQHWFDRIAYTLFNDSIDKFWRHDFGLRHPYFRPECKDFSSTLPVHSRSIRLCTHMELKKHLDKRIFEG